MVGEEIEERRGEDTLNDEEGYKISRIPQYLIRPMVRSKVLSPHCNVWIDSWMILACLGALYVYLFILYIRIQDDIGIDTR